MMAVIPTNYAYRAEWNPLRRGYFARCLKFPGRYAEALTAHEAVAALETVIAEAVAEMAECGQSPPDSLISSIERRSPAAMFTGCFRNLRPELGHFGHLAGVVAR